MFGLKPSIAAVKALKSFKERKITNIVELGAGLGRDTIYFAKNSISLPCGPHITEEEVKGMCKVFIELMEEEF